MLRYLLFTFLVCLCAALAAYMLRPQKPDQARAAADTYIDNVQLVEVPGLYEKKGLQLLYVAEDTVPANGKYFCGGMTSAQVKRYARNIITGLERLPKEAWRKTKLTYVLLCDGARAEGVPIGGIPVPPIRLLMLDAGSHAPGQAGRLLFHEFYHYAEYAHDGIKDRAWDREFGGYKGGYSLGQVKLRLGSGGAGFINEYGAALPHEERAEIFSYIITRPEELKAYLSRKNDRQLRRKVEYVAQKCRDMFTVPQCEELF